MTKIWGDVKNGYKDYDDNSKFLFHSLIIFPINLYSSHM